MRARRCFAGGSQEGSSGRGAGQRLRSGRSSQDALAPCTGQERGRGVAVACWSFAAWWCSRAMLQMKMRARHGVPSRTSPGAKKPFADVARHLCRGDSRRERQPRCAALPTLGGRAGAFEPHLDPAGAAAVGTGCETNRNTAMRAQQRRRLFCFRSCCCCCERPIRETRVSMRRRQQDKRGDAMAKRSPFRCLQTISVSCCLPGGARPFLEGGSWRLRCSPGARPHTGPPAAPKSGVGVHAHVDQQSFRACPPRHVMADAGPPSLVPGARPGRPSTTGFPPGTLQAQVPRRLQPATPIRTSAARINAIHRPPPPAAPPSAAIQGKPPCIVPPCPLRAPTPDLAALSTYNRIRGTTSLLRPIDPRPCWCCATRGTQPPRGANVRPPRVSRCRLRLRRGSARSPCSLSHQPVPDRRRACCGGRARVHPVLSSASAAAIAGTRSIESAWPAQRHLSQHRPSAHEIPLIPAQSMHLESLSCTL